MTLLSAHSLKCMGYTQTSCFATAIDIYTHTPSFHFFKLWNFMEVPRQLYDFKVFHSPMTKVKFNYHTHRKILGRISICFTVSHFCQGAQNTMLNIGPIPAFPESACILTIPS